MARDLSIELSDYFNAFIEDQLKAGHYGSASDVVSEGLRMLEKREAKLESLRRALIEGEESGPATPLDMEEIKREARSRAAARRHAA